MFTQIYILLYISNCAMFYSSIRFSPCPDLGGSTLRTASLNFPSWLSHLSQARGSHCQIVVEWSKRPEYFFPAPSFLLYGDSGSTCMPAGHSSSKVPALYGLWECSCLFSPGSRNGLVLLLWASYHSLPISSFPPALF